MTWEKTKEGWWWTWRTCMQVLVSKHRIAWVTKVQYAGFSPANISVRVFLQKWTWEPESFLKSIQNYPVHIYNINCKTAEKTLPNSSLMHLCHLVNKKQVEMVLSETRYTLASSEMLANWLLRALLWLTGLLLLSITDGLPVSNPRRIANACDLEIQSHQKLFCVAGGKKKKK